MSRRCFFYIIVISLLFTLILSACKPTKTGQDLENAVLDTTSMSVDSPEDTLAATGFNLTEYDTPPTPVTNPMPVYPVNFRKSGIQGVVVLDVEVLQDGTVGDIVVMKSLLSKEGAMNDAAVASVKSWLFKPALLDNAPVKSRVNIPISFSLKGQ